MASIEAMEGVVTIGVDPHPGSHTAAALDPVGTQLASTCVANGADAGARLLEWGLQFPHRRWAVEGAGNRFVHAVVLELLAAGEEVHSVPPSLTSQYRNRRGRKKDDVIDAANAARALQANPALPCYQPGEQEVHLKAVSRAYQRLSTELKRLRMMKRSATDPVVLTVLETAIGGVEPALHALKRELQALAEALAPALLERQGVGPVVAGILLAEVGQITRFGNSHQLAAYAGVAPIPWQSGAHSVNRLNPGGNRRLNCAAYLITRTRLRLDPRTQAFRDRKLAEGKTQREIIRSLKTYVLREVYAVMLHATVCPDHATKVSVAA